MSHLGARVSALLDGRLSPVEEERCWAHVHECHTCRDLVEREGWVKTRLAELSYGPASAPSAFKESLRDRLSEPALLAPAFPTAATGPRHRVRGLVAIGGGAASACVVGVLALGLSSGSRVDHRPPVTDLSRPIGPSAPVRPASPVKSKPTTPLTERLGVFREKIAP